LIRDQGMQGFQVRRKRYWQAGVAALDVSGGEGVNATGVELTNGDANCASLVPQRFGIVFEGMRQCAALRAGQQYDQQQVCG